MMIASLLREFGTAVDIATKSNAQFDEIFQLKSTYISKASKNINKGVTTLKNVNSNAKKILNVWIEDATISDFKIQIDNIKQLYLNSGVEINIKFGQDRKYINLLDL